MKRKGIMTKEAGCTGPYSHAVDAGDYVFLSGQTPIDPATGEVVAGGITEQTRQSFSNLFHVLEIHIPFFFSPILMRNVMGDFIQDLIGDIEHNMQLAPPNDQYFEELSIQKFTLQQLLQEIGRHEGDSPTAVVARFVGRMSATAKEDDPRFVFSISRDAAQSILSVHLLVTDLSLIHI